MKYLTYLSILNASQSFGLVYLIIIFTKYYHILPVYQIFVKLFDLMNHSICNASNVIITLFNIANLMVIPMSINVTLGLQKS